MGFDLCVLWQVVSLINLKMKSMLAFDKRYLRRNSTWVISRGDRGWLMHFLVFLRYLVNGMTKYDNFCMC